MPKSMNEASDSANGTSDTTKNSNRLEILKEEGNKLFLEKKYTEAITKYTKAISLDGADVVLAVLYANRAACRLSLKGYAEAVKDARKATELDPTYTKAWARLATAHDRLKQPSRSREFWQKAIDTLASTTRDAELKQKEQYEKSLAAAEAAIEETRSFEARHGLLTVPHSQNSELPWTIAIGLRRQLKREGRYRSCAWALADAYESFQLGTSQMDYMATMGGHARFDLRSIENITNGILLDHRVFHITDSSWILKVQIQIRGETTCTGAWTDADPATLIHEAPNWQVERGWDWVRQAVGNTVRCWILQGYLAGGLRQDPVGEMEYLDNALEVINWGRRVWHDISTENRGVIFLDTFLYGVQKLHMEAVMKVCSRTTNVERKRQLLEKLLEEAESVIRNVDRSTIPRREDDPVYTLGYYYHPRGYAYSMRGYYLREQAKLTRKQVEQKKFMREAATAYKEASKHFDEDDESHAYFLCVAAENMLSGSAPAALTLECLQELKEAVPKIYKIWANSSMSRQGREQMFQIQLKYEPKLRRMLEEGKIKNEDPVKLEKL
ncbi:hypothetical protein E1B28_009524 [Marasmius oreades]|uniref:Uncharacterized protein n=1 Tax=Marasmius oreades TaxID=181124 RepID=A0A9P7RVA9_9AGAR|nr:uncharacterized protein E1B28_009524 [Marasmius oreades]KAG7090404.1 hypothetical protein E1B28_009524 [Marasmius oreades]